MQIIQYFIEKIRTVQASNFDDLALEIFQFQAKHNPVYADFIRLLKIEPQEISSIYSIPYLPIELFKNHKILCQGFHPKKVFESSGTSGGQTSKHWAANLDLYLENAKTGFEKSIGPLAEYEILALLPSYLERNNSSLVEMVNFFVKNSLPTPTSFYLNDFSALKERINHNKKNKIKTILFGVSFALVDFALQEKPNCSDCLIIETGGMKGTRKEMVREELHQLLSDNMNNPVISSEYGMTEMYSQAYLNQKKWFDPISSLKPIVREFNDPFQIGLINRRGGLNFIDLANLHSCCFLETQDLGLVNEQEKFQVLGRLDNSMQRGCNLLYG